jgi:hypothetical protein
MTEIEKYEFDRQGYLVLRNFLTDDEVNQLAPVVDELEYHAAEHNQLPPRKKSKWGPEYHHNQERGYYVQGGNQRGQTFLIEDFFNFSPAFDLLVAHPKTLDYIRGIVQGELGINNSELRVRYPGNFSGTHGGGPTSQKYRYAVKGSSIDCMMVRIIYFVHDVSNKQGAFCVVPCSHKSAFSAPYKCHVDEEPGMLGLEVKAGDAILFTENLRHGGLTNLSNQTRKTLHVGYGPDWMMSQNIATMDETPNITPKTWARYDEAQRRLFQPWLRQGAEYH